MKFTRLRLLGFKSFVEASEFLVEPGLTAVVGPNGCGKSNLVEALRWVMGESSYKSMRASGMDDVIFSGSATRPARNSAEVTLFLDNRDRTAPAAFNDADELQVSRRIERAEGSLYRINGREARARDVQLLFADQSTGARSPSMVGQGRVSELIQAKPQARRALLEEAAGISGLHSRRHEAEMRLNAAEANLDRLDDVVGELQTQIESLKRQVRAALRFKALSAEMRQAEAVLLHIRWRQAVDAEATARAALTAATLAVAERANAQIAAARAQAVNRHGLPALRAAEQEAAAAFVRLQAAKAELEAEAGRVRSRREERAGLLAQLDRDLLREERIAGDSRSILRRLDEEERDLHAAAAVDGAQIAEAVAACGRADAALSLSEGALSLMTGENAEFMALRAAAEREVLEAAQRRDRSHRALAEIDRDLDAVCAKLDQLLELTEKRRMLGAAEAQAAEAEALIAAAERRLAAARLAQAAAQGPLGDAKTALARMEGEARTLHKMVESQAGRAGLVPVAERITVERGYEKALAAALGADLDAPLEAGAPVRWAGSPVSPGDPVLPAGAASLAAFVQAPEALLRRLKQVGVVEEVDGRRLAPALAPGQRLVSRAGSLWRWDGLTVGAEAPSAAAERMARRNRLSELKAEVDAIRARLAQAAETARAADGEAAEASGGEARARAEWRRRQEASAAARETLKRAEDAAGEFGLRRAALSEAQRRVAATLAEAQGQADAAAARLRTVPDPAPLKRRLGAAAALVGRDRQKQGDAQAFHDRLTREGEARRARIAAIARDRESWAARVADAGRQIRSLEERRSAVHAELNALAERPGEIERERRSLLCALSGAEAERRSAADRLAEAENRQRHCDGAASKAVQALASARENRARAEERLNAAEVLRLAAEARIREVLGIEPHLAAARAGRELAEPLPDEAETEGRLERLGSERDRLGAVNLRAEEESRELGERVGTIVSERGDVIEAVKTLRSAIARLNREGRDRLLAAFGAVNGHFQALFAHLFGGGTAELRLVESDDPLEAGVEIVARPPGKRPQTMTLLSGGEQALTAMSLIFAVFLTNPAPICVLDEVDAPLDDHNVERLCNLLDRMVRTTETRFVVITHNPITMARMDRLFGVTMAEQGVSQLVSVDLQGAERLREAG